MRRVNRQFPIAFASCMVMGWAVETQIESPVLHALWWMLVWYVFVAIAVIIGADDDKDKLTAVVWPLTVYRQIKRRRAGRTSDRQSS